MKKLFVPFLATLINLALVTNVIADQTKDTSTNSYIPSSTLSIIVAIDRLGKNIKQAIDSAIIAINTQLTKVLNKIFTGHEDGTLKNTSLLMRTYELFIKNFYSWYSNRKFDLNDLKTNLDKFRQQLDAQLAKDAAYNGERSQDDRKRDATYLLTTVKEVAPNNLTASDLGLSTENLFPYGGLDYKSSNTGNYLNINDLLGPSAYTGAEQTKAKALIAHLLNSGQTPTNFVIPSKSDAVANIVIFKTKDASGQVTNTEISTKTNLGSLTSEYDRMVSYLKKNSTYQKIRLNSQINNVIKSLFAETLYRPYEKRIINDKKTSLLATERKLAEAGTSSDYYQELKKQTAADVNLEILHAINKLVYFLQKVHEDNERLAIINTIMVQKLDTFTSAQTEYTDVRALNNLIVNKCWDVNDDNREICSNPSGGVSVV